MAVIIMNFGKKLIYIEIGERISAVQQVEECLRQFVLSDEIQIGDKLPTEKNYVQSSMWGAEPSGKQFVCFRQKVW